MSMKPFAPLFASLALAASALLPFTSAIAAKPRNAPSPAPNDLLDAVAWTQSSIEHDLVFREIYRDAQQKLLQALHDKRWNALPYSERTKGYEHFKPAVILDIDETVLGNSAYEARLIKEHKEYGGSSFATWIREEKDRALPGARAFTRFAARHGVRVFYITNRGKFLGKATAADLRKLGFPVQGHAVLGLGTYIKGCLQLGSQKTCRRELVGKHYRVLMQFGDQTGDFMTVLDKSIAGQRKAMARYRNWIGERWFVLPNPMYGDWLTALFNNYWEQPAAKRREEILQKLHTDQGHGH